MKFNTRSYQDLIRRPVITGLFLLLVACQPPRVPYPDYDLTPPLLHWEVTDPGINQWQSVSDASSNLEVSIGSPITIRLVADDNRGVKRITLSGGGTYTCSNGNLSDAKNMDLATQERLYEPDRDNYVFSRVSIQIDQTYNWTCDTDWIYVEGSMTFLGEAENYYNGIARSNLTLIPVESPVVRTPTLTLTPGSPNSIEFGNQTDTPT